MKPAASELSILNDLHVMLVVSIALFWELKLHTDIQQLNLC